MLYFTVIDQDRETLWLARTASPDDWAVAVDTTMTLEQLQGLQGWFNVDSSSGREIMTPTTTEPSWDDHPGDLTKWHNPSEGYLFYASQAEYEAEHDDGPDAQHTLQVSLPHPDLVLGILEVVLDHSADSEWYVKEDPIDRNQLAAAIQAIKKAMQP